MGAPGLIAVPLTVVALIISLLSQQIGSGDGDDHGEAMAATETTWLKATQATS